MFFRGKQPEAVIWRRFRSGTDGFAFARDADHYTAQVAANAERIVDLFHALSEHLSPAVDVVLEDVRRARQWRGADVALPDVRETIARLKLPLATYGGVELAVYTSEDQLTLTPHLELFIYARTERWLYLLKGKGLEEQPALRERSWRLARDAFAPAPDLTLAVDAAVERLALAAA